ncbi:MAG: lysophospholipid acyltransferase family protein [Candidatus Omnitrophica bacterium]|nr:lysophospholipid acyltransferase family protein [Candidatus Omnitrophota bacterium]
MSVLLSIFIWLSIVMMTVFVFLAVSILMLYPFDRKKKISHACGFWWAEVITALNPFWKIKIQGLNNFDKRRSYVIIANHQSMADIALVYKTHRQFKWVAKESLFSIPVFGWCMSAMKYIKLSRGEFGSIRDTYEVAAQWLKEDISVLFFPEGTRSPTGELSAFKNGAFKLALKEKKPILPICISGSRNILPRGSWVFNQQINCTLKVLPAIETIDFLPDDFIALRDAARGKILAVLK